MAPAGVFARRNGEQAVVHRCLGCGFERHCRIAADDDYAVVMRLPVVTARAGGPTERAAAERTA
jgi:hypothetical protein